MDKKYKLTKALFEKLVIKASQPLPERVPKPDSASEQTSESQSSDGCSDTHIHLGNEPGT